MISKNKILVTIITGFLGAGKTTFINDLLKNNPDIQFALVENEFGEVAIDTKLIKGLDASQMFELKNGCICCTISGEYELVLLELAERFPNVNHLLIETTGIADPAPVIRPFFRDENLQSVYHFNGTICLVDTLNFNLLTEKEISLKQLAAADCILINKSELLMATQKEKIKEEILQINPSGKIHFSQFGNSPSFDLGSTIHQQKFIPDYSAVKSIHPEITSQTLIFQHPLNREQFTNWLSYTLDLYKKQIYRVKGILHFENEPYLFVLQGVGGGFEITESELFSAGMNSDIVLIGRLKNVNFEYIY
ncbi:MAG: putative GTPase G3E [Prolixibacteraceae bacterium]|nr:MAG: putative GTPase G3E [Prolixibacteraceae bacterium]